MMKRAITTGALLSLLASPAFVPTATAQDAAELLRRELEDLDVDARWYYGDFERARAEARRSGRPILTLFR